MSEETITTIVETPGPETKPTTGSLYNRYNFAVAAFVSKEESRYNLKAICVEPGQTVATNGFYLGVVTTPNLKIEDFPAVPGQTIKAIEKPILFPAESALKLAKELPKKGSQPVLQTAAPLDIPSNENEAHRVGFVWTDLDVYQPEIACEPAGPFPAYQACLAPQKPLAQIRLDVNYLQTIAKFMQDFTKDNRAPENGQFVDIDIPKNENTPVRFTAHNGKTEQDATVVLMGMRRDTTK